jgi:hypothetical protein
MRRASLAMSRACEEYLAALIGSDLPMRAYQAAMQVYSEFTVAFLAESRHVSHQLRRSKQPVMRGGRFVSDLLSKYLGSSGRESSELSEIHQQAARMTATMEAICAHRGPGVDASPTHFVLRLEYWRKEKSPHPIYRILVYFSVRDGSMTGSGEVVHCC